MTTLAGQSLFRHIETHDVNAVRSLLQNATINLDERDEDGQTCLMIASQQGTTEIVEILLQHPDVDINAVDNDSWTALLNASKGGHLSVVGLLCDHDANIEHRDIGGWTALMWAAYKGRTAVARKLLDHDASPNIKGEHNMSPLIWAAGRGHLEVVRALLAAGAHVNTADKYGTTPLIWAARKGYCEIVEILLSEGANVDMVGMNSWTALMLASKGGFLDVVLCLLEATPNLNAVDKDVFTALTWAAKEGYGDTVEVLLKKGAYFNMPDRNGDTILIHAVKGGHYEATKALLKKYADVEVQGAEEKTALYWAVEKGHINIARLLMEFNASTEIANKDGDTPLLKAVRSRNLELLQMLLDRGAKISATDKRGDTALHISVRARSKRATELLLRNPKDGRLLYKPNKNSETPYQLDAQHEKSVLTQVFGARNLNADESIQGYDLYGSTVADVLSEPSLHTPITVGLFAKWGSGKSFLIRNLIKEMKSFTQQNMEETFSFSVFQFFISLILGLVVGWVLSLCVNWKVGLGVGLGIFLLQYIFLGVVHFGSLRRDWDWAWQISVYLAVKLQFLQLLLRVIFCNQPARPNRDTAAVKFLFTDNARLASVVGEKSITGMISTLCDALEEEYGLLAARLYRVFRPQTGSQHGRFKTICCVPYFVITVFVLLCMMVAVTLMALFGVHSITNENYTVVDSVLIAIAVVVGIALLSNVYTWSRMVVHLVVPSRKRVQRIADSLDSPKLEGFMQDLKKEVELLGQMTQCMDAMLNSHTRLVVIVDGLDSCEQERLLQVLDIVHMLFGDEHSPFITILAVDPHVIIKGIEHNLQGLFRDSSINGHDYLRNMVQLPFFLQSQTLPRPRYGLQKNDSTIGMAANSSETPHVTYNKQDSVVSLPDATKSSNHKARKSVRRDTAAHALGSNNLAKASSQLDLTKSLGKSSYFSDINPRMMKRLMNIIAVTGRLLRACNIDFNWYKLAAWINITEQWPYRLSWMIMEIEDNEGNKIDDNMPLKALYTRILPKLPVSKEVDPHLEIDRNARKLEIFLANHMPVLTVGDLRRYLPCTINVDPYLRKLIKEMLQNMENMNQEMSHYGLYSPNSMASMEVASYAWPHTRRPPSRFEVTPSPSRATPTRPGSSARIMGLGYMANPSVQAMMSSQMMMGPPYATVPPYPVPSQVAMGPARSSPRIHLQGGFPSESLISISVEGVCSLLTRMDGLNKAKVVSYCERLQENNVTGIVLLNCDMLELKGVMQMTFGDWELFRTLVQTLREREMLFEALKNHDSAASLDEDETDSAQPPVMAQFTQQMTPRRGDVQMPQPSYPQAQATVTRRLSTDSVHSSGRTATATATATGRVRHGSGSMLRGRRSSGGNSGGGGSAQLQQGMKRQDSFVGEFLQTQEALRGVIEATGVMTDSESEDELEDDTTKKDITPIAEEGIVIHASPTSVSRRNSMRNSIEEQAKSQPDPRYQVGDDSDDDSDSEELALISRKKLSSQSTKSSKLDPSKLTTDKHHHHHGSSSSAETGHAKPTNASHKHKLKSTGDKGSSKTSSQRDKHKHREEKSGDKKSSPGIATKGSSGSMSKMMDGLKRGISLHRSKSKDRGVDDTSLVSDTEPEAGTSHSANLTDIQASFPELMEPDPMMSGASSFEHLSLRRLAHAEGEEGPSAFKVVTPPSPRSRASSRGSAFGQALRRSQESSRDEEAFRLYVSEGSDVEEGRLHKSSSPLMMKEGSLGSCSPELKEVRVVSEGDVWSAPTSTGMTALPSTPSSAHTSARPALYVDTKGRNHTKTSDDVFL